MGSLFTWLLFFFILIALLAILVYQLYLGRTHSDEVIFRHSPARFAYTFVALFFLLMCLADLEFDYINPYDSASRINQMVMPEFITQGVLCVLYLVTGHWFMSLLSVPYLYYNVTLYMQRKHLVDVTEIFNLLNWEKKQRLFKLGYLIFLLFLSLFWMIWSALEEDERDF